MTLSDLYEARIDSTRSINYYSSFDCYCEAVFFSLCDGDTGEELKSYEVSFDEETGEVDCDVEFTSEHDSGYCDFKRLPKSVREHVLAIVKAYIEEQGEEEEESVETVETKQADNVEIEVQYATGEQMTLAQQFNELFRYESSEQELNAFTEKYQLSQGTCFSKGFTHYSVIFADGSVWGYGMVPRNENELNAYETIYHQ